MKIELNFVHEEDFVRMVDRLNQVIETLNAVNTEAAKRMTALETRIRFLEMTRGS